MICSGLVELEVRRLSCGDPHGVVKVLPTISQSTEMETVSGSGGVLQVQHFLVKDNWTWSHSNDMDI